MKLAVVGSRKICDIPFSKYIGSEVTEIVSGGAVGVDKSVKEYAIRRGIRITEFLPDYKRYGRRAPLKRNEEIAEYADEAVAFWDGKSRGTDYTVRLFRRLGKRVRVIIVTELDEQERL